MNNETSWFKSSENQFSSFSWGGDEAVHSINLLNDSQSINQAWQVQNPYNQSFHQSSHGKRKGSNESTFHPVTKQLITEARIINSMQQMNLGQEFTNEHAQSSKSNRGHDEGFEELDAFESDSENEDNALDISACAKSSSEFPQFYIHNDVKEEFARIEDSILPKEIVKSINQSALALVVYQPIEKFIFKTDEENAQKKFLAKRNNALLSLSKEVFNNSTAIEDNKKFPPEEESMELYPVEDQLMKD